MFGLSKSSKKKQLNDKNAVNAEDILKSEQGDLNEDEMETILSIPTDWNVSNEERYVFAFHNSESPKLKVNQISIYGMELSMLPNKSMLATGLIRNTVQKDVKFGKTMILLLGPEKEVIAKKEFDLERIGIVPPNGARPWKFTFEMKNMAEKQGAAPETWSLAFEIKKKHKLDLEESWEKSIAEQTKTGLEKIIEQAPSLKPGEVNFMGIDAKQKENNDLAVTILIRNGSEKNISLQQIPLGVKDTSGEEIARGSFKLEDFTVKANTSKPWTFIFPSSMIVKDDIDLSRWQAYAIGAN